MSASIYCSPFFFQDWFVSFLEGVFTGWIRIWIARDDRQWNRLLEITIMPVWCHFLESLFHDCKPFGTNFCLLPLSESWNVLFMTLLHPHHPFLSSVWVCVRACVRACVRVCVCVCVCVRTTLSLSLYLFSILSLLHIISSMMMMSWCLMSSDVIWHIRDKLWPIPKHGSIKSTYVRCMRV